VSDPRDDDTIYEQALDWMWEHLPTDECIGPSDDAAVADVIEKSRIRMGGDPLAKTR